MLFLSFSFLAFADQLDLVRDSSQLSRRLDYYYSEDTPNLSTLSVIRINQDNLERLEISIPLSQILTTNGAQLEAARLIPGIQQRILLAYDNRQLILIGYSLGRHPYFTYLYDNVGNLRISAQLMLTIPEFQGGPNFTLSLDHQKISVNQNISGRTNDRYDIPLNGFSNVTSACRMMRQAMVNDWVHLRSSIARTRQIADQHLIRVGQDWIQACRSGVEANFENPPSDFNLLIGNFEQRRCIYSNSYMRCIDFNRSNCSVSAPSLVDGEIEASTWMRDYSHPWDYIESLFGAGDPATESTHEWAPFIVNHPEFKIGDQEEEGLRGLCLRQLRNEPLVSFL